MKNRIVKSKQKVFFFCVIALFAVISVVLTGILLGQITDKMNNSANESLITSSRMIVDGIESKMESDASLLDTYVSLLALEEENSIAKHLQTYRDASGFLDLIYMGMDGRGFNSFGEEVKVSELLFEEIALSRNESGISPAYDGESGHVQIAFEQPVMRDGKQAGAFYAVRLLNDYRDASLFSFSNGNGRAYIVDVQEGKWLIEGRNPDGAKNIYGYLKQQGNGETILDTLRSMIGQEKSGTLKVSCEGEDCLIGFLPMEKPAGSYLVSVLPIAVLQRESTDVMRMIRFMLTMLVAAGICILLLLLGRQSLKVNEAQRAYRERLFQNLSSNIDFGFLLYTPSAHKTELVSDNIRGIVGSDLQRPDSPEAIFDCCGLDMEDQDRKAFLSGNLKKQVVRECMIGKGANELTHWIALHLIPADYGQSLMVMNDTTQEHHMVESLGDALEQAKSSNQAKTVFFSTLSHDLRTPMNGIIGMTNIAAANVDDPLKVKSCLNKIMAASEHLLSLINEILDMSRIESGKFSLKEEEVHLPSLIASILEFVDPVIKEKSQELQLKSSVLEYDTVIGDSLHLQKVFLNLLSNAVKYTQEGGTICLKLEEKVLPGGKMQLYFTVEDNGIGMSPDFVKRIFQPFERADDGRSSRVVGTGLGMSIVKGIVDLMGGDIQVESELNQGSRFTVMLPLAYQKHENTSAFSLAGRSVLVVDDDRDTCESVTFILGETGIHSQWVLTGEEAVKLVKERHEENQDFYAVILDWKMPGMDGLETARRIREEVGRELPILLLSAYNWENVEKEALEIGINSFLTKPIFKNQLLNRLKYSQYRSVESEVCEAGSDKLPNLSTVNILVAEDNDLNREIITEILSECGANVTCAVNGREALDCYRESEPGTFQMIFMDVHMPEMDGLEATKSIRNSGHADAVAVPVIAMTADVFHEDVKRCLDAGMDAHIGKPIAIDKLLEILEQYGKNEKKGEVG
ncbi:MAG: response regulator [Blautia sp.]